MGWDLGRKVIAALEASKEAAEGAAASAEAAAQAAAASVEVVSDDLVAANVALLGALADLQRGISWPGGGIPVPESRWHVALAQNPGGLATVTKAAPGPGKALVVSQAVFTLASNQALLPSLKSVVIVAGVDLLFAGFLAIPAIVGASAQLTSRLPIQAPPDTAVTGQFGSASGANIYQSVALSGYVVLI